MVLFTLLSARDVISCKASLQLQSSLLLPTGYLELFGMKLTHPSVKNKDDKSEGE